MSASALVVTKHLWSRNDSLVDDAWGMDWLLGPRGSDNMINGDLSACPP